MATMSWWWEGESRRDLHRRAAPILESRRAMSGPIMGGGLFRATRQSVPGPAVNVQIN